MHLATRRERNQKGTVCLCSSYYYVLQLQDITLQFSFFSWRYNPLWRLYFTAL